MAVVLVTMHAAFLVGLVTYSCLSYKQQELKQEMESVNQCDV
jgi:hypothetical protein